MTVLLGCDARCTRWLNYFTGAVIAVLVLLSVILTVSVLFPDATNEQVILGILGGGVIAVVAALVIMALSQNWGPRCSEWVKSRRSNGALPMRVRRRDPDGRRLPASARRPLRRPVACDLANCRRFPLTFQSHRSQRSAREALFAPPIPTSRQTASYRHRARPIRTSGSPWRPTCPLKTARSQKLVLAEYLRDHMARGVIASLGRVRDHLGYD